MYKHSSKTWKNIFKDNSHSDYTHFSIPKTKSSPNLTQKPYPPLLIGGGGEKRTLNERTLGRTTGRRRPDPGS